MCRYVFKDYKSHFACFYCRKAFRKLPLSDYAKQKGLESALTRFKRTTPRHRNTVEEELGFSYEDLAAQYLAEISGCPQCGKEMAAMGLDFKAPPMREDEAWKIIAALYEEGFAFQGCGCGGPGYAPPSKLNVLPAWMERHQRKGPGQKLLSDILARSES